MSRDTENFSMYSLMSTRMSALRSAKRNSASARASSVFPTPVGPAKMNEPMGRRGSLSPAHDEGDVLLAQLGPVGATLLLPGALALLDAALQLALVVPQLRGALEVLV